MVNTCRHIRIQHKRIMLHITMKIMFKYFYELKLIHVFYFILFGFFLGGGVHIGSGTLVLHFIKIAVVPTCMRYTGSGQGPAQTIALIWSPILCLSYNRKDEKYFKMTFSSIRMYAPPTGT